ncbi:MAG: ribonuclease D, partial [Sedimenticolaceae bacterium]
MMQERFVDTPDALIQLCNDLKGSEWLALDTEFIREKTYYPKLCLVQICNGEIAACVDPIKLDNIQPLLDLLFDGSILNVFHAARQDLEIF